MDLKLFWVIGMDERSVDVEKSKRRRFRRRSLYARFVVGGDYLPLFKGLIKALKDGIDDEIPLTISYDGLSIRYLDPSRVMMADIKLSKYCFNEYEISSLKDMPKIVSLPQTVMFDANDVLYALEGIKKQDVTFEVKAGFKTWKDKETITIRKPDKCPRCGKPTINNQLPYDKRGKDGNSYKCVCGWRGKVRHRSKKVKVEKVEIFEPRTLTVSTHDETYDFSIFEAREEVPPEVVVKFGARVTVDLKRFRGKLKKLAKRFDSVAFIAKDETFMVVGEEDRSSGKLVLSYGNDMLLNIEVDGRQKAYYSIVNLLNVLPQLGDVATLEFSSNLPLKTSINVGIDAQVDFYLAPRIVD